MAYYDQKQIDDAVDQHLISQADAEYMARGLEPGTPWGGVLGGLLGASLGYPAYKAAGKLASVPERAHRTGAVGAILGGGTGAAGGAYLGDTLMPAAPGEGYKGVGGVGPNGAGQFDRDAALRMLIDPETPKEHKKGIMQALEMLDAYRPPHEQQYGKESSWAPWIGALAGAGLLGAAGVAGSKHLPAKYKNIVNTVADTAANVGFGLLGPEAELASLLAPDLGEAALGALGALTGGVGGYYLGDKLSPGRESPYKNPLGDKHGTIHSRTT